MRKDSIGQAFKVILGICLVCSFFVSAASVFLNPIQRNNHRLERIKNILIAGGLYSEGIDVEEAYRHRIESMVIDLRTGERIDADRMGASLDADDFDIGTLAVDPEYGEVVPAEQDLAKVKRRPKMMAVYFVKAGNHFDKVILPIYGKGLWSTLYGFLTLERDLRTITGITFYQHGETPGLGGEIDDPRWQRQWRGKRAFDSQGRVIIEVLRGAVDPLSEAADHQIAGLSGATITSRGVDNLVAYWLGEYGYGPFLQRLRREWEVDAAASDRE
jgi:Na+-transporting NADH:ubiquinone oxidoreductase subunit C